jgi:hypothetical protein
MMDPSISIYRRDADLIAVATGQTTMGVGIETGPAITLLSNLASDLIAGEVMRLFDDCGATVVHPKTFGGSDSPTLQQAKCLSWSVFMKSRPEYMRLTMSESSIRVEFWRRDGKGFAPANPPDVVVLPRDVSPECLGDVLLGRCNRRNAEKATHDSY